MIWLTRCIKSRYFVRMISINAERFWGGVKIGELNECWPWQRTKTGKGYGMVCLTKAEAPRNKRLLLAHRVAWTLKNGGIPDNLFACHKCDNPICCNPNHIFLGTCADNQADMVSKGRQAKGAKSRMHLYPEQRMTGTKHPLSKLTDDDVRCIRSKRRAGVKLKSLADEYGVHFSKIWSICAGRSWAHVSR